MSYLADYRGLGFEHTAPEEAPASSYAAGVDIGGWDWHQWALVIAGGWLLFKALGRGAKRAYAPIRKGRQARKRSRERISKARRELREAEESAGGFFR